MSSEQDLRDLSVRLRLQYEDQDWGITNADAKRLTEFIQVYDTWKLTDTQRWQVFELVLASMNEALQQEDGSEGVVVKVHNFMTQHGKDYPQQVAYWAGLHNSDEFPLTKVLKEIGVR